MDTLSIFGDIGNVLGYPAMLLIFWLYTRVKDLEKRLNEGNDRFDKLESGMDKLESGMGEIKHQLGVIQGQLSMITRSSPSHTPEERPL
jgi:hypothetical protein